MCVEALSRYLLLRSATVSLLTVCSFLSNQTMLVDKARLQAMRSKLHHLMILASFLLVARSFSCGVLFSSPEFVEKLKNITTDLTKEFSSK